MSFADDLIRRQRALGHPLCVGLDPHLVLIPPLFRRTASNPADPATAAAVEAHLLAVIDRLAGRVAAVKPQAAFFERLGWRGMKTLEAVVRHARARDLLVVLDAKRGDIGSTAAAYAAAYLETESPCPADAMTVNPYLGRDSLEPFFAAAAEHGRGLFVLAKTSNPGAADLQDLELAGGGRLRHRLAELLAAPAEALRGPQSGWSSLGVVVGATYPGDAEGVRERLPHSLFLVPGYGAQGASAAAAVRGFVRGSEGRLEGGLVSSSRAILFPDGADTGDPRRWERAIDQALDRAVGELGDAVA